MPIARAHGFLLSNEEIAELCYTANRALLNMVNAPFEQQPTWEEAPEDLRAWWRLKTAERLLDIGKPKAFVGLYPVDEDGRPFICRIQNSLFFVLTGLYQGIAADANSRQSVGEANEQAQTSAAGQAQGSSNPARR